MIDAYNLVGAEPAALGGVFRRPVGRERAAAGAGYSVFAGGALGLCAFAPTGRLADRLPRAPGRRRHRAHADQPRASWPTSTATRSSAPAPSASRAWASGVGLEAGPIVGGAVSDWMGLVGGVRRERRRRPGRARDRNPGRTAVFSRSEAAAWTSAARCSQSCCSKLTNATRACPHFVAQAREQHDCEHLHVRGQVLAVVLLASLTYALIEAPRYGWGSPRIAFLPAADVVLAVVFVVVELRVREPLIDLRVFRDRQFSGAIFITVAVFFAYSGFVYFTALYLQQVRGMSAARRRRGDAARARCRCSRSGRSRAGSSPTRGARGVLFAGTAVLALGHGCSWRCPSTRRRCGRSSYPRCWSASATA